MDEKDALAASKSAEAANASAVAQEAVESARMAQFEAIMKKGQDNTTDILSQAIQDAFGEKVNSGRFIDVSRIPLICQAILNIEKNLSTINEKLDNNFVTKERFSPIEKLVYGVVSLILVAVVTALLATVIMHK